MGNQASPIGRLYTRYLESNYADDVLFPVNANRTISILDLQRRESEIFREWTMLSLPFAHLRHIFPANLDPIGGTGNLNRDSGYNPK